MIQRFKKYLEEERQMRPKTVYDYVVYITDLSLELGGLTAAREFHEVNNAIKKICEERGLGHNTRYKIATIVKVFYKWAMREKLIDHGINPYPFHDFKKVKSPEAEFFTEDEIESVVFNPKYTIQDIAMLSFVADTGVRANELQLLNVEDFDLKQRVAFIKQENSKTGAGRPVVYSKQTATLLKFYLYCSSHHYEGEVMFPSAHWQRMPKGAFGKHLMRLGEYESPKRGHVKMNPHKFRHSVPVRMLENGSDLTVPQQQLGHTTTAQTSIYTHRTIKQKIKAFDKFNRRPKIAVR